ncbi:GIY-YIG nuclease family protein [Aurantimonas sp. DM33-3]|uniref:GIY-YIG nuclease family protein n=1 Tax=Aurantimonas sp. DM33-3 TaxID=2766955 RepID=UPI00165291EC|nr:GIY-YIG nuclease family protein [Aurantimonas sp. DM33-3]MBC6715711.1 GIY-YIG nuclease family protein [Aurantimonas sp. DM33-3]
MKVTSYGLFWRADEIEWFPGQGNRNFRLLGRIGKNRPAIRVADFRRQQGIYILFDEYGPAYVGLAKGDRLGARLRDHHTDHLNGKWDRFSWFGFNVVGKTPDKEGILSLNQPSGAVTDDTSTTIGDLEALLIAAMGPKLNLQKMRFKDAERWEQIGYWEWDETYRARIAPEE